MYIFIKKFCISVLSVIHIFTLLNINGLALFMRERTEYKPKKGTYYNIYAPIGRAKVVAELY